MAPIFIVMDFLFIPASKTKEPNPSNTPCVMVVLRPLRPRHTDMTLVPTLHTSSQSYISPSKPLPLTSPFLHKCAMQKVPMVSRKSPPSIFSSTPQCVPKTKKLQQRTKKANGEKRIASLFAVFVLFASLTSAVPPSSLLERKKTYQQNHLFFFYIKNLIFCSTDVKFFVHWS